MNRTGLSQSFSLHSDSTSVPSIPPANSGSNKQHPALLALHRQSTSIGSIRPSSLPSIHPSSQAKPSQAIQQGRGLEGAPQTLHIPHSRATILPPASSPRRGAFWSSQRDHFRQQGTTKQESPLRGSLARRLTWFCVRPCSSWWEAPAACTASRERLRAGATRGPLRRWSLALNKQTNNTR